MKFNKYVDLPNELISKCIKEENGLTYDSLGFLIHLKQIFRNGKIIGDTNVIVSKKSSVNIYTVKTHLPILIDNGLCCKYNGNIIIYSDDYIKKTFGNVSIINKISLDGCSKIKDYAGRLKLSLLNRKINQINYAVHKKVKSDKINNDLLDMYRCIGVTSISKYLGCSYGDTDRLLMKEEKKGYIEIKHVYFNINDVPSNHHNRCKIFKNNKGETIIHFGSWIDVKCIHNFNVMESKN